MSPTDLKASFYLAGTAPATAGNYGVCFFTNDTEDTLEVYLVRERHATAGNDAGAVTAMLKCVPSGTAAASGTDMLSAGISLKASADTNQSGAIHATQGNRLVRPGESLAVALTGTPTAVAGLSVTAYLRKFI